MLHVVVGVVVRAERLSEFHALLAAHAAGSRAEPGCLRFEVLRETGAPCRFRILETWLNPEALEMHRQTGHYARWKAAMPSIQALPRTHEEYEELPHTLSPAEIATRLGISARQHGRRVVFTNGCFDVLTCAHVAMLQEARQQGDMLVVGLNSDASVRLLKGPGRPVNGVEDRRTVLAAMACVDHVLVFDAPTPLALIHALRPACLVKGGDYRHGEVVGAEFVESYGGSVYLARFREGQSTTGLIRRLAAVAV